MTSWKPPTAGIQALNLADGVAVVAREVLHEPWRFGEGGGRTSGIREGFCW